MLPRGNLTANPHPGGHGHSSTEAAQDKRHGKRLAYTAEWPSGSVELLGSGNRPWAENSESLLPPFRYESGWENTFSSVFLCAKKLKLYRSTPGS